MNLNEEWEIYENWKTHKSRRMVQIGEQIRKYFEYEGNTSIWYEMIHLLIAIGLTPGGSSILHIYT
jgi:hypothetical protein